MAEISVPAWPIPIHQTKLVIPYAHPTGMLLPQAPIPLARVTETAAASRPVPPRQIKNSIHQRRGVLRQIGLNTISVRAASSCFPTISGWGSRTAVAWLGWIKEAPD